MLYVPRVNDHFAVDIPFHNLKKLHKIVKDQMPKPKKGVFDAYKEIIPTIFKQRKDLNYFINVELPNKN